MILTDAYLELYKIDLNGYNIKTRAVKQEFSGNPEGKTALSLLRAQVPSLVGEPKSNKLFCRDAAKIIKYK